jgi:hypothetical protein
MLDHTQQATDLGVFQALRDKLRAFQLLHRLDGVCRDVAQSASKPKKSIAS